MFRVQKKLYLLTLKLRWKQFSDRAGKNKLHFLESDKQMETINPDKAKSLIGQ